MMRRILPGALVALALAYAACGGETESGGNASGSANAARPTNMSAAGAAGANGAPAATAPQNASPPASDTAAAPPAPTPTQTQTAGGVRRISIDEALPLLDRGQAVAVDVRTAKEYKASHIRGALSVPLDAVSANLSKLPKNKLIITYCA